MPKALLEASKLAVEALSVAKISLDLTRHAIRSYAPGRIEI